MTFTMSGVAEETVVSEVGTSAYPPQPPVPPVRPHGLWHRRETVVAALVAAIGLAGVAVSWAQAADEALWRDQLRWITVAATSAVLFVFAVLGWTVIGMRRLRRACHEVAEQQRQIVGVDDSSAQLTVAAVLAGSTQLWTVPPMTRAHRPGCLLLRGKSPVEVPSDRVDLYSRCGVCKA